MDPNVLSMLLQLIALASQLAPVVIQQIDGIKQQEGKSAEEIFNDAGVRIDENNAQALAILAALMTPADLEPATAPAPAPIEGGGQ